jgi:hypothetical protein
VSERFLSFPLLRFFGIQTFPYSLPSLFVYGRARLTMEGKSVMPMFVPESIFGHLSLLQFSLGKNMQMPT